MNLHADTALPELDSPVSWQDILRRSPLVLQEGFDRVMRPAEMKDERLSLALENKPQIESATAFHERPNAP